ncbi:hypothetical protein [Helicobacter kayseriensis]|uniref:hypothetical protein n=1 Tax=Helicobacter kayseriensis TaxID=2905877 RepID=UPI001E5B61BC|nr:hypothetical protein [Helicobacter kayseriensis]MCE3047215.1 hypothetical protein [Helicobacter kayseriensis]MCE3048586.1 hypothetical protein [Helicobacter kayseriensis]
MDLNKISINKYFANILLAILLCLWLAGCTSTLEQKPSPSSSPFIFPSQQHQLNIEDIPHTPSEQVIDLN